MFAGKEDPVGDTGNARKTRDTIGKNVVHYEEIEAGHLTFTIAKDMSYFTDTVMGLLTDYQPLP